MRARPALLWALALALSAYVVLASVVRLGLAIRAAVVLVWAGLAWATLRGWWQEGLSQPRETPRKLFEARRSEHLVAVAASGLALVLILTLPARVGLWVFWTAWAAFAVPILAHVFWVQWLEDRAQEEAYRTRIDERHERALAAGVGIALPARLRRGRARACPACAEMYALWRANRELSVDQTEAIVERQIVLGRCPPHSWWRDE